MSKAAEIIAQNDYILLFDGVCNLCNDSVNFIIDHDRSGRFRFAALQEPLGQALLEELQLPKEQLESIVFICKGKAYRYSRAALEAARRLDGLWKLLYVFIIVPPFIRNAVYKFIARKRYVWFGKQAVCRLPSPELKGRFLIFP